MIKIHKLKCDSCNHEFTLQLNKLKIEEDIVTCPKCECINLVSNLTIQNNRNRSTALLKFIKEFFAR